MRYQVNSKGKLTIQEFLPSRVDVQNILFENVSLFYEMNKKFFASQDQESLKLVIVTIMKSI